eukprot:3523699-Alexandrium_andersonii.AAC.1
MPSPSAARLSKDSMSSAVGFFLSFKPRAEVRDWLISSLPMMRMSSLTPRSQLPAASFSEGVP